MIGKKIKEKREHLKMSQEELASILGVGKSAVSNYENGHSNPNYEMIRKLLDAFKCDANTLFLGTSYKSEPSPEQKSAKFYKTHLESLFKPRDPYYLYHSSISNSDMGKNTFKRSTWVVDSENKLTLYTDPPENKSGEDGKIYEGELKATKGGKFIYAFLLQKTDESKTEEERLIRERANIYDPFIIILHNNEVNYDESEQPCFDMAFGLSLQIRSVDDPNTPTPLFHRFFLSKEDILPSKDVSIEGESEEVRTKKKELEKVKAKKRDFIGNLLDLKINLKSIEFKNDAFEYETIDNELTYSALWDMDNQFYKWYTLEIKKLEKIKFRKKGKFVYLCPNPGCKNTIVSKQKIVINKCACGNDSEYKLLQEESDVSC